MTAGENVPLPGSVAEGMLFFLPLPQLLELLNLPPRSGPEQAPPSIEGSDWPPHAQWRQLLADGLFAHPAARDYWQQRLDEERILACQVLPRQASSLDRLRCLTDSPLSLQLGCPQADARLREHLRDDADAEALLDSPLVIEARLADVFAAALRLAAWRVVDISLRHWELLAQDGQQDEVLLESFLPSLSAENGHWSNPVEGYLAHLAGLAGCPEQQPHCSYLAQLWAEEDGDTWSRERQLYRWRQGRERADAWAVRELMQAILRRMLGEGCDESDLSLNQQLLCESFHFAESCAYLRRTLSRLGLVDTAITEIFAVYRSEYARARAALGRPLAAPGT